MTEPTPETAPEALSRIGHILADAERQVTEIVADAERQSAETHAVSRRMLEARATELAEIAAGIAASAAAAQNHLNRLHALTPLELPPPVRPGPPSGSATPAPQDAPAATTPAPPAAEDAPAGDLDVTDASEEGATSSATASAPDDDPVLKHPGDWTEPDEGRATFRSPVSGPTLVPDDVAEAPADETGTPDDVAEAPTDETGTPDDAATTAGEAPGATDDDPHADLPIVGGSHHAEFGADPPEKVDSARLVALSMAANGRSREEVEAHVRDELGITDHAALIDYVFGISAPSSIVPSWPPRRRRR